MKSRLTLLHTLSRLVGLSVGLLLAAENHTLAQTTSLSIDTTQTTKTLTRPLVGENVTWLLSSDRHLLKPRDGKVKIQLATMGVGFARFPNGTLGQNYRWHTPTWNSTTQSYDYSSAYRGLKPSVMAQASAPGTWTWAVNPDGTFIEADDFDEFIEQCHYAGLEPIVVVNVMGDRRRALADPLPNWGSGYNPFADPDPSKASQFLANEAAAWVAYAKTRGYHVKYWEIGNEQDLSGISSLLPESDYIARYGMFAQAMKNADPGIKVGPGFWTGFAASQINAQSTWVDDLKADAVASQYLDFFIVHQYASTKAWTNNYSTWSLFTGKVTPALDQMDTWIRSHFTAPYPELLVTEMGPGGPQSAWPEEFGSAAGAGISFKAKSTYHYLHYDVSGSATVTGAGPNTANELMSITELKTMFPICFRISAQAAGSSTTQYLAVGSTPSAAVTFTGTDADNSSLWVWRHNDSSDLLESYTFPGYFLQVSDLTTGALGLLPLSDTEILNTAGDVTVAAKVHPAELAISSGYLSKSDQKTAANYTTNPADKLLREFTTQRVLRRSSSQVLGDTLVPVNATPYLFQMQGTATSGVVKILQRDSGKYLAADPTTGAVNVNGTGTDDNSTWKYTWVDTNQGSGVDNEFKLQVQAHAKIQGDTAGYLCLAPTGTFAVAATGHATDAQTQFKLVSPPAAAASDYTPKPTDATTLNRFENDYYKGLVLADMALESLNYATVGAVIHWNTQSAWQGRYGTWGAIADAFEPTKAMNLTPLGTSILLLNAYVAGDVLALAPPTDPTLRTYACFDQARGRLAVIVLNKSMAAKTLSLNFTGTTPFVPASTYDEHTLQSGSIVNGVPDQENTAPVINDAVGLSTSAQANQYAVPPLSLKVFVFTDPAKSVGPVTGSTGALRMALQSVANTSVWMHANSAGQMAVAGLNTTFGSPLFDLTNLFALTLGAAGNTYQLAPASALPVPVGGSAHGFATYSSTSLKTQLTLGGSVGAPQSEWSWSAKNGTGGPYVQLFTNLVPTAAMRANLTTPAAEMPVDANGTTGNWAQFAWSIAPAARVGDWVIIRSYDTGAVLSSDSALQASLASALPAPAANGNVSYRFKVTSVGNGLVTLLSALSPSNYLKAGSTPSDPVTITGTGSEADQASYWRPLFAPNSDVLYLQSAKTGGLLGVPAGSTTFTPDTSGTTLTNATQFYWVDAN